MTDIQGAVQQLYENSSLREDLNDEQAKVVLAWAEKQIPALAEKFPDQAAFDEAFGTLQRIIRGFNRLIGHGADYSSMQFRDRTAKVVEWARSIQLPVDDAAIDTFVSEVASMDAVGQVAALSQALAPTTTEAEAETPVPDEPTVPEDAPTLKDKLAEKLGQVAASGIQSMKDKLGDALEQAAATDAQGIPGDASELPTEVDIRRKLDAHGLTEDYLDELNAQVDDEPVSNDSPEDDESSE